MVAEPRDAGEPAPPRAQGAVFAALFCLLLGGTGVWHLAAGLAGRLPAPAGGLGAAARGGGGAGMFAALERRIEQSSPLAGPLQSAWAAAMWRVFGEGNDRVLARPEGLLFYRPGIVSLTGPGPLKPLPFSVSRPAPKEAWTPPLEAVKTFAAQLRERGIRLLLVPVPDKAAAFAPGAPAGTLARHPDAERFYGRLRAAGVRVLPLRGLEDRRLWLRTDTHWTGEGAMAAAEEIAAAARKELGGGAMAPRNPREGLAKELRTGRGDLAAMLGSGVARLIPAEETSVYLPPGGPGREGAASARVVWIGDSFTNIYRDSALGFGSGSGVAALCEALLGEPVRVFAVNGGGTTAARADFARSPGAAEGVKVVVWALAERDLFLGEKLSRELGIRWDETPLAAPSASALGGAEQRAEGLFEAEGVVSLVSNLPDPASTPYADCLLVVAYDTAPAAPFAEGRILAVHRGFEGRVLLEAAAIRHGERHHLLLRRFDEMPAELQSRQKADDTEEILPLYWVERWRRLP